MTDLTLIAFNAQGFATKQQGALNNRENNTWEYIQNKVMRPIWNSPAFASLTSSGPILLAGLTESGAPFLNWKSSYEGVQRTDIVNVDQNMKLKRSWVGWSNPDTEKDNNRCSTVALQALPTTNQRYPIGDSMVYYSSYASRPMTVYRVGAQNMVNIGIVHLNSNSSATGQQNNIFALQDFSSYLNSMNSPAIIMGDFNINIYGETTDAVNNALQIAGWGAYRTGNYTQKSGGELDWAIATTSRFTRINASFALSLRGTPNANPAFGVITAGISDHAALMYNVSY